MSYIQEVKCKIKFCWTEQEDSRITCKSNPSPCFPGVECRDTAEGPRCGRCPAGYVGDGRSCKPGRTCHEHPCFPGIHTVQ